MLHRKPHMPLPEGRASEGRPLWEPPILSYSDHVGEEYEKKREALLKYCKDDAVGTTRSLDVKVEWALLYLHKSWVVRVVDYCSDLGTMRRRTDSLLG